MTKASPGMCVRPAAQSLNFLWPYALSTATESSKIKEELYAETHEDGQVISEIIKMMQPGLEYFGPGKNMAVYGSLYSAAAGVHYINRRIRG